MTEFLQSVRGQVFSSASFNAVTPSDLTHPSPFPLPFPSRVSVLLPLTFISLISDGESAIGPSRAPINSQLMSHFAAGWGLGERGGGAFYESIGIRRRLCVCEDGGRGRVSGPVCRVLYTGPQTVQRPKHTKLFQPYWFFFTTEVVFLFFFFTNKPSVSLQHAQWAPEPCQEVALTGHLRKGLAAFSYLISLQGVGEGVTKRFISWKAGQSSVQVILCVIVSY